MYSLCKYKALSNYWVISDAALIIHHFWKPHVVWYSIHWKVSSAITAVSLSYYSLTPGNKGESQRLMWLVKQFEEDELESAYTVYRRHLNSRLPSPASLLCFCADCQAAAARRSSTSENLPCLRSLRQTAWHQFEEAPCAFLLKMKNSEFAWLL